jgi:hypothetical protein
MHIANWYLLVTLKVGATCTSETLTLFPETTWLHISEDEALHLRSFPRVRMSASSPCVRQSETP